MAKITGGQKHLARLSKMTSPEAAAEIGKVLFVVGNQIQVDAQISITNGAVSGKFHKASLPGEPPKANTHALDRQIETVQVEPLKVEVQSNDPKSAFLEFGTSRMAERPFMRPAAEKNRKSLPEGVIAAVNRITRVV